MFGHVLFKIETSCPCGNKKISMKIYTYKNYNHCTREEREQRFHYCCIRNIKYNAYPDKPNKNLVMFPQFYECVFGTRILKNRLDFLKEMNYGSNFYKQPSF